MQGSEHEPPPQTPAEGRVLLLTPTGRDAFYAATVLEDAGIPARACTDVVELCDTARDAGAATLVVAVEAIEDGRHAPLVELLNGQPAWSDLPVVIITAGGETAQNLLREHLSSTTSVTYLDRPFRAATLTSIVGVCLRARGRQYELRNVMAEREALLRQAEAQAERMAALAAAEARARGEAEHAGRMKDEFLATLSHELRTPLNAILGWAQILRRGGIGPEEVAEGVDVIERNARAQTQLIEDLLDMSRIIAGKVRLDAQTIRPSTFVDAALETMRPAAKAKGIELIKTADPSAGPVLGDAGRLQQVVWNLLSNAIKFTPAGGQVTVCVRRTNDHVEISVADSGQGMKADFLPHVFDRFRQADGSATRRHSGLGLGLAIVKQLVDLHGGRVNADSPGEGRGSTFTIELPLSTPHGLDVATPARPVASPAVSPDGQFPRLDGVTVLVVDDEPDARGLVRRVLETAAARVLTAGSAEEALSILDHHSPDIMVSDIGMPDVDGFEFLRLVRARGNTMPAIAVTAFARSEDRTRALLAGFAVHVAKPVEPWELLATVANATGRARA